MTGGLLLLIGVTSSVALFLNGLWLARCETMPTWYARPRWIGRWLGQDFQDRQWRHLKMVARVHMMIAPLFLLLFVTLAVLQWRQPA
jgi:hypothetical protein